uniref:ISAzo13 family transposase n=1 Tax=Singulisphaera acidiphila TaxID=466153 RepID=UPI0002471215
MVGEFRNGGREWQPSGQPEEVLVHDFMDKELGKAIPYGVYDVAGNQGWVSVGIDHDTARFAAEAIRRWWRKMGSKRYRGADRLLIIADGGGSNGSRCRLWKVALQELAGKLGMSLYVCHFPPGTSKWNKIEHRMFCHITQNWRGRPLVSHTEGATRPGSR